MTLLLVLGLILFAGPKNAGKTILMYACLKEIQKVGASIMTVESPIEFDLDGVTQVAVSHEPGANDMAIMPGLNSALNQSPQVLMMGDVAEAQVAQVRTGTDSRVLDLGHGFSAEIPARAIQDFDSAGRSPASLEGRLVRVRGYLRDGRMRLDHPEGLEILNPQ